MVKRAERYEEWGRRFAKVGRVYRRLGWKPDGQHLFRVCGGGVVKAWPPLALYAAQEGLQAALAYTSSVPESEAADALAGPLGVDPAWLRGFNRGWFYAFTDWADTSTYLDGFLGFEEADIDDGVAAAAGWESGVMAAVMVRCDLSLCPREVTA